MSSSPPTTRNSLSIHLRARWTNSTAGSSTLDTGIATISTTTTTSRLPPTSAPTLTPTVPAPSASPTADDTAAPLNLSNTNNRAFLPLTISIAGTTLLTLCCMFLLYRLLRRRQRLLGASIHASSYSTGHAENPSRQGSGGPGYNTPAEFPEHGTSTPEGWQAVVRRPMESQESFWRKVKEFPLPPSKEYRAELGGNKNVVKDWPLRGEADRGLGISVSQDILGKGKERAVDDVDDTSDDYFDVIEKSFEKARKGRESTRWSGIWRERDGRRSMGW